MSRFLYALNGVVWGAPMLIFFILTGLRISVKSQFFQIRGFNTSLRIFLKSIFYKNSNTGISQFSAFCSVLGACIGTGNIVGVATALYSGGPGSVFWMIFSACFSMMTAYAENFLGAKYTGKYRQIKNTIGSFSYIENGLKIKGLSKIYAVLFLMSVMGMGNMAQSNSLSEVLKVNFNTPKIYTAIAISIIAYIIIRSGIKGLSKFQTFIIPVAVIFYCIVSFWVLFKFRHNILPTIELIFHEAFSIRALNGFGMYKAIRYGVSRGVFSNEAGLGSSTLLHAQAQSSDGKTQGISAMLEVFIDTILMCGLTALVILVSTDIFENKLYGAQLSVAAYSTIGSIGKNGISILTAIFAFTSLTGCSFYGEKSFQHLFGEKHANLYKVFYCILVFAGSLNSPEIIWEIADICNALMAIPNLFAVNCLLHEVEYPSKKKRQHFV